jgi:hypothetical protein
LLVEISCTSAQTRSFWLILGLISKAHGLTSCRRSEKTYDIYRLSNEAQGKQSPTLLAKRWVPNRAVAVSDHRPKKVSWTADEQGEMSRQLAAIPT